MNDLLERKLAETALMRIHDPVTIYRAIETHNRINGAMGHSAVYLIPCLSSSIQSVIADDENSVEQ